MVAVGDPIILARMPGYMAASTAAVADSSTFTTSETSVISVTASLISGVTYRIVFEGAWQTTVADSQITTRIREDNTSGTIRQTQVINAKDGTGSLFHPFSLEARYTAASTASKTFIGTGVRLSGTGTINLDATAGSPAYLYVEVVE